MRSAGRRRTLLRLNHPGCDFIRHALAAEALHERLFLRPRSADAAGATAVIVCDQLTDLYNPNLIRSSIGTRFSVPCVAATSEECIAFLKEHGVRILTAQLQDSELYYDTDMRRPTALVMGTESTGLTTAWRKAADAHLRIPMLGRADSLNVSVSAAILLFEAVRQRHLANT